jgi:hypothetical protein
MSIFQEMKESRRKSRAIFEGTNVTKSLLQNTGASRSRSSTIGALLARHGHHLHQGRGDLRFGIIARRKDGLPIRGDGRTTGRRVGELLVGVHELRIIFERCATCALEGLPQPLVALHHLLKLLGLRVEALAHVVGDASALAVDAVLHGRLGPGTGAVLHAVQERSGGGLALLPKVRKRSLQGEDGIVVAGVFFSGGVVHLGRS